MNSFLSTFAVLLVMLLTLPAEQISVRGYIMDVDSKKPLPYANISIDGTDRGAVSNYDGEYFLRIDETENILIVSYIGYKTDTITVATDTASQLINLPIFLVPEPVRMGEVVVNLGYNYAEELLVNAYKKVNGDSGNLRYRQAFYRETIMSDSLYDHVREIFFDLLEDANGINERSIRQGREASLITDFKKEMLWGEPNFSFFTLQVKAAQRIKKILGIFPSKKGPTVVMPVRIDPGKYFDCIFEGTRVQDGRNVSIISVTPNSKYDRPIMSGIVEIFEDDYQILRYDLRVNHPDLNKILPVPHSGPFSDLGLYSTNTEINFIMVNRELSENVWGLDRIEVGFSNRVKSKTNDNFDRIMQRRSVMVLNDFGDAELYSERKRQDKKDDRMVLREDIEYDPRFWIINSAIIAEIPMENEILQFFKRREFFGYLFPGGLPYP